MKSIIKPLIIALISVVFIQCENSKYDISKGKVGELTSKTTLKQVDVIFKNDSIVKVLSEGAKGSDFFQEDDKYLIFEKGGKHLLTIVPKEQLDSVSTIKSIEVFDKRFKTASGLNINSSFQEINTNNSISKVESSFLSVTLFIDDLNATISLDKEDLGLKDFSTQKVSIEQIPDLAKIKSFTIWFN
ncbi:hypothetical protein [Tenacibaculum finnmarkense]|uniref:Uncharacterized protein n=1 Tax=Tenacibaculum finnmarkense genomovar ulcerans TaxID=2781388 RepID=A0A2I2MAX7_9FLAO|nr:hypothetical protein [Tenacibaculum finnmarkense]ALU75028.1 hypothetical protein AUW17_07035 [Tenacibaculum dicentrarchi]MBE7633838.1 hypothetical protein [Tenacibaculum finnmarkense genomovar ulcerans]MBE7697736.1 hypothetical protein [Tenacibaculum finnmarkense genomovar ulcerans]MCD8429975.1 hypothetical protein [Tenacibaculum finnmarkense genomovar ulcerans]MCG8236393.1 hypothetical protein [Tenacibaculum finnmarkense genomovar ulcerans]